MTTFEAVSQVIDSYNSNPFNAKKFYYECGESKDKDGRIRFEIKFGVSQNQSNTFVGIVLENDDKERVRDGVYSDLLEHIFTNAYCHLDVQK